MTITTNEMLADLGGRIVDLIQENLTPPQFITALSGLATNWDGGTLSAVGLGRQLSDSIEARNRWVDQASAYFQGTATGGPNSDGKYPFTTRTGATVSMECPAKLAAMVTGPSESAQAYAASALAARDVILGKVAEAAASATAAAGSATASAGSATAAAASATTAGTAKTASETARDVTQGYRDTTLTAKTATETARDLTLTYRDGALTAKDAAVTAKTASESARDAAIAAASSVDTTAINNNLALKFDKGGGTLTGDLYLTASGSQSPGFHLKANGMGTDAKISRAYSQGGLFTLDFVNDAYTAAQPFLTVGRSGTTPQAINLFGTSLSFNSTAITTATTLASGLATKQNTLGFTPVQQGTGVGQTTNVIKLGWSNEGKLKATIDATDQGAIVFESALTWTNLSGKPSSFASDWSTLTSKPSTFAPSAHTHVIADTTGLQAALDAKLATTGFTYTALPGKPSLYPTDTANVSGLTAALALKADASALTSGLAAKAPIASPQFTGTANITGAAATTRLFGAQTAGVLRWMWGAAADTESGSNAGSNWALYSYADNGAFIGTPISVTRASGAVTFAGAATFNSTVSIGGATPWTSANFTPSTKLDTSAFTWANLSSKPTTFAPSAHTHATSEITGLDTALAGKAALSGATFTGAVAMNSTLAVSGNVRAISTGGTGQFTAVSGNTMAGFYQDSTNFYLLKSATSNTTFDGHRPIVVSLSTGSVTIDGTGAGGTQVGGTLGVTGTLNCAGEIYTPGWIRLTGNQGMYWNAWGGGWTMTDSTWMRSYGDKSILTGGNIQCAMWTVTSDERLKTDIKPLTNGSEIIYGTNVYSFIKGGQRMWGVLAQEAQANPLTEVLVNEGGQLLPDGSGNALTVDSMGYVYALIDTVKEQNARIAALEARLA
uniref:Peptidase S74 domain-containing protein n=1 Tax=Caulobacter sp. (strain K31) TaxID=366602 RepID=B0T646_CAUSK